MKKEAFGAGLALTLAMAAGGDSVHDARSPVDAIVFDVPAGDTYDLPLDPDQAQQALATGVSCDITSITGTYNYSAVPDTSLDYPHTEVIMDVGLHFSAKAAAAYRQYKHDDGVIWDGAAAAEVYAPVRLSDAATPGLQGLGSSILLRNTHIERPDMTAMVPTAALKTGNILVPYRVLSLQTNRNTVVSQVPCNQALEIVSEQPRIFKITALQLPLRTSTYSPEQEVASKDYSYGGNFFPQADK